MLHFVSQDGTIPRSAGEPIGDSQKPTDDERLVEWELTVEEQYERMGAEYRKFVRY